MKICPKCMASLPDQATSCEYCGSTLTSKDGKPEKAEKKGRGGAVAAVIAIVLVLIAAAGAVFFFLRSRTPGEEKASLPGFYVLEYLDGEELTIDKKDLRDGVVDYYMVINDDGTGWMALEDDTRVAVTDLTWDDKGVMIGEKEASYELEEDRLYFVTDDAEWAFFRESGKVPSRPRERNKLSATDEDMLEEVVGYYNCVSINDRTAEDGEAFLSLYDTGDATVSLRGYYDVGSFTVNRHGVLAFETAQDKFSGTYEDGLITFSFNGTSYVMAAYGTDAYTEWKAELRAMADAAPSTSAPGGGGPSPQGGGASEEYVAPEGTIEVTFTSSTGYHLQAIFCTEVNNPNWGSSVHGELEDATSCTLTLAGSDGNYDLRVVDQDSWYYEVYEIALFDGASMEMTVDYENEKVYVDVTGNGTSNRYEGGILH